MSEPRSDEGELTARRVLVTGATSGLGLAMAAALSAAGAEVVVGPDLYACGRAAVITSAAAARSPAGHPSAA